MHYVNINDKIYTFENEEQYKQYLKDKKYNDFINYTKSFKYGLLNTINNDITLPDKLINTAKQCQIEKTDNKTDYIFKSFCLCGNMSDCMKETHLTNTEISDTIFFKQSSNINITLLAKALYCVSNTKFKEFLEWQIKVILEYGEIDINAEYKKWKDKY